MKLVRAEVDTIDPTGRIVWSSIDAQSRQFIQRILRIPIEEIIDEQIWVYLQDYLSDRITETSPWI